MKNKALAAVLLLLPIFATAQPMPMGPALRALAKAPTKRTTVKVAPAKAPEAEMPAMDGDSSYNYFHMMAESAVLGESTLSTLRDAVIEPKPSKKVAKKPVQKAQKPVAPVVAAP